MLRAKAAAGIRAGMRACMQGSGLMLKARAAAGMRACMQGAGLMLKARAAADRHAPTSNIMYFN